MSLSSTHFQLLSFQTNNTSIEWYNKTKVDYFFPLFFPLFLVDFLVVFFSSFFCIAFTEATFFTIFCSSIRKARRMLFHQIYSSSITDHARTYDTDYHHKHESQNAEEHTVFSYCVQRCEESTNSTNNSTTYTSKRFLATTTLHGIHNLLVVLNNKSSTYSLSTTLIHYQGSSQYGTCLKQYCKSVCDDR